MSLTENDRVMVYGNKSERLPTLAELSEYMSSTATPVEATNVSVEADVVNDVDAGTLQEVISALAARIQALEDVVSPPIPV